MPSQYDTETKAGVIADARLGKPSTQISRERNLPSSTAREWIRAARDLATSEDRDPLLTDGEYRLAFQAQVLTDQALQSLADSDEPLHKYLVPLNIVRGTAIDKVLARQALDQKTRHLDQQQQLTDAISRLSSLDMSQLRQLASPNIIEGHAVTVTEPDSQPADDPS